MPVAALYPLVILTALVVGGWLWRCSRRRLDLPDDQRAAIVIAAFCGAMLGAKLPFVVSDWTAVLTAGTWFANGKTILSGLVGGYVAVEATEWVLGVRVRTGDAFVVPVAAAIAIGRLGCFCAGCCYGTPTSLPWGMACAATDSLARHPNQLYEFAFHALAAGAAFLLARRRIWKGHLMKAYIIAYCAFRIATETIRPEPVWWSGGTFYQWFAASTAIALAGVWWHAARQAGHLSSSASRSPTSSNSMSADRSNPGGSNL
ncbi:MAG: diacylglyceryl transferase [Planctomycetota bacterium]|nr:MAG: diacylglyceryl transferase [Planctomycetota bacterium]